MPELPVPGEIFAVYQPVLGHVATLLWLNLRFSAQVGHVFPLDNPSQAGMHVDPEGVQAALKRLIAYDLLEYDPDREEWVVHDPLTQDGFARRFGDRKAGERASDAGIPEAANQKLRAVQGGAPVGAPARVGPPAGAPGSGEGDRPHRAKPREDKMPQPPLPLVSEATGGAGGPVMRSPLSRKRRMGGMLKLVEAGETHSPQNPDMQAVVQIYHKRIGMIGPTQFEKLRFWVEEQGMEGAVVALAIEETVRSADVPRISYLEGILRNWYNDGIRTISDVQDRKRASKVLSDGRESGGGHEGMPNASAYQYVSSDLVAKWKEMYPDEYDA